MADLNNVPRAIRNETFYAVARICTIVSTIFILPFIGWQAKRIIDRQDMLAIETATQNIELKLLNTKVADAADSLRERLQAIQVELADHENRLRQVERRK